MKTLLFLLVPCLPLLASEQDKVALRKLAATYEQAIADRDLSALKPHLAEDFTAVMITADEVKGFNGIVDYWTRVEEFLGEGGTYQVKLDPDDTIFEGDLAIAKGSALEQVTRSGSAMEFTSQWTAIARRDGDAWKLVRIQASIDPVDNPIISSLQRMKLWTVGVVSVLGGVLIGRLIPRRKAKV